LQYIPIQVFKDISVFITVATCSPDANR